MKEKNSVKYFQKQTQKCKSEFANREMNFFFLSL